MNLNKQITAMIEEKKVSHTIVFLPTSFSLVFSRNFQRKF